MVDQYEETRIKSHGDHQHVERVVVDKNAEAARFAYRLSALVWLMFGILISGIGLRVFLKLIGANPANLFAQFVYSVTDIFLWPFYGLTGTPSANGMVLEIPSIIAMLVYAIIAWVIARLIWLLFRP
jgi:YggT family protein